MSFYLNIIKREQINISDKNSGKNQAQMISVGLGGLGVTCSPRVLRFAGSNPVDVDGFFQDAKILSTKVLREGL